MTLEIWLDCCSFKTKLTHTKGSTIKDTLHKQYMHDIYLYDTTFMYTWPKQRTVPFIYFLPTGSYIARLASEAGRVRCEVLAK